MKLVLAADMTCCRELTWMYLQVLQQRAAGRYSPLQAEALGLDGCMCTTVESLGSPHGIAH